MEAKDDTSSWNLTSRCDHDFCSANPCCHQDYPAKAKWVERAQEDHVPGPQTPGTKQDRVSNSHLFSPQDNFIGDKTKMIKCVGVLEIKTDIKVNAE